MRKARDIYVPDLHIDTLTGESAGFPMSGHAISGDRNKKLKLLDYFSAVAGHLQERGLLKSK